MIDNLKVAVSNIAKNRELVKEKEEQQTANEMMVNLTLAELYEQAAQQQVTLDETVAGLYEMVLEGI